MTGKDRSDEAQWARAVREIEALAPDELEKVTRKLGRDPRTAATVLDDTDCFGVDKYAPPLASDLLAFLTETLALIPEERRGDAVVQVIGDYDYGHSIEIIDRRPASAAELFNDYVRAKGQVALDAERERETYERLKAKFEGGAE